MKITKLSIKTKSKKYKIFIGSNIIKKISSILKMKILYMGQDGRTVMALVLKVFGLRAMYQ